MQFSLISRTPGPRSFGSVARRPAVRPAAAALVACCGLIASANAQDLSWDAAGGGLFGDAANWLDGLGDPAAAAPGAGDDVLFALAAAYAVDFQDTASELGSVRIEAGSVTFVFDTGGSLTVSSSLMLDGASTSLTLDGGILTVGSFAIDNGASFNWDAGELIISGGGPLAFSSGSVAVAAQAVTVGAGGLFGSSLLLNADRSLTVSHADGVTVDGAGSLLELDGGTLEAASVAIRNDATLAFRSGSLTVTGGGPIAFESGQLVLGAERLFVADGGLLGAAVNLDASKTVTVDHPDGVLIDGAGATLSLDGGALTAASIETANDGAFTFAAGSLELTASGVEIAENGLLGASFTLGAAQSLSAPTVTVDGAGSVFTLDGGTVATATLTIQNGGLFDFASGSLGGAVVSLESGLLRIGAGSFDVSSAGLLGDDVSLAEGRAVEVTHADGTAILPAGRLAVAGGSLSTTSLAVDAGATLEVSGGMLAASEGLNAGAGSTLIFSGGEVAISGVSAVSTGAAIALGSNVVFTNGEAAVSDALVIGDGTLIAGEGSVVTLGDVARGAGGGSVTAEGGVLNIDGAFDWSGGGQFDAGLGGSSSVINLNGSGVHAFDGAGVLDDTGLSVSRNTTLNVNAGELDAASVQVSGRGALALSGGGTTASSAVLNLGEGSRGGVATAAVRDGAAWAFDQGTIAVGGAQDASLIVEGGGTVTGVARLTVGGEIVVGEPEGGGLGISAPEVLSSAEGNVTVTGAGSSLTADEVFVGSSGSASIATPVNGRLGVFDGGVLDAALLGIGTARDGANGIVTVGESGGAGGTITAGRVSVGFAGKGLLQINSGAVSSDSVSVGSAGSIRVNGGELATQSLSVRSSGSFEVAGGSASTSLISASGSPLIVGGGTTDASLNISGGGSIGLLDLRDRGTLVFDSASGSASLSIGGFVSSGSGALDFRRGRIILGVDAVIGDGGLFGDTLELTAANQLDVNSNRVVIRGTDALLTLNGSLLDTAAVASEDGGRFVFESGSLFHGSALAIGDSEALQGGFTLSDGGLITTRGLFITTRGLFAAQLESGGDVTIDGGRLSVTDLVLNGGSLSFLSGSLDARGASLTLGSGFNTDLAIGNGDIVELANLTAPSMTGVSVVDGGRLVLGSLTLDPSVSLVWDGGGQLQINGSDLLIGGPGGIVGLESTASGATADSIKITGILSTQRTVTIGAGQSIELTSGRLTASSLINNGSFAFTGGTLDLTGSDLSIGSGGLIGPSVDLTPGKALEIGGTVTIDATSALTINGGRLEAGAVVNNGTFEFNSGTLRLTSSDLSITSGGLIGDTVDLVQGRNLDVDQPITVAAGASLLLNGGTLEAGAITNEGTFEFNSGLLTVTASDLRIDSGELIGGNVVLGDNDRALEVHRSLTVGTGASLAVAANTTRFSDELSVFGDVNLGENASLTVSAGFADLRDDLNVGVGGSVAVPGGFLDVDDNMNLGQDASLSVTGGILRVDDAITLASGADFELRSGEIRANTIVNESGSAIDWIAGTLDIHGTLSSGTVLGSHFTLGTQRTLEVRTLVVEGAGTSFTKNAADLLTVGRIELLDGGRFSGSGAVAAVFGSNSSIDNTSGVFDINGTLTISGDYTQGAEGVLEMTLFGLADARNSLFEIGGDGSLAGVLNLDFDSGFTGDVGDRIRLIDATQLFGEFSAINFDPRLFAGLLLSVEQVGGSLDLLVERRFQPPLPAPASGLLAAAGLLLTARRRRWQ